jgi:hypothetical protein
MVVPNVWLRSRHSEYTTFRIVERSSIGIGTGRLILTKTLVQYSCRERRAHVWCVELYRHGGSASPDATVGDDHEIEQLKYLWSRACDSKT